MRIASDKKITSHPSLVHARDLRAICAPLQALNITYFSHVRVNAKGQFSALGLEPEFVRLYLDKKYYNYDIHMARQPFTEQYVLWDTVERTQESKQLYDDFKAFELDHTFTIMREQQGVKECFHFAADQQNHFINQNYLTHLELLKKFIHYFNDQISQHKELRRGYEITFEVEKNNSGYFTKEALWAADYINFNQQTNVDRIYVDCERYLTKREFECLYWLAQGKTLEEAAQVMAVTLRTMKAHVVNIKEKFSCDNQFQLGMLYQELSKVL